VTVSDEGGVRVELERARAEVGLTEGQTEPVGFNPARLSWPFWAKFPNNSWATCPHQRAKYFFLGNIYNINQQYEIKEQIK
jgi:hypothetical protein